MTPSRAALLQIRGLRVVTPDGRRLVDGVDLTVSPGAAVALAGESGSGKSLLAQAVLGVLPKGLQVHADRMRLQQGESVVDLLQAPPSQRRALLGRQLGMVWQDPLLALTPVLTVGAQLEEALRHHHGVDKLTARADGLRRLEQVGLQDPRGAARALPHELSGGMRQRVTVALALAGDPALLVADEPTTALDATTQARLLRLLQTERDRRGLALLLISHDLGIAAACTDEIHVMYSGRVVESGPSQEVLSTPKHPYTLGLVYARKGRVGRRFGGVAGKVPSPSDRPTGCAFRVRCPFEVAACADESPDLVAIADGHRIACPPVSEGRVSPTIWPREVSS
ncbi:MAG: ABC transporter ATP-binding protein [Planctomycetota bacterium]|nr:ABC transporter ATP-binding protein [Planctomycetota bacterium]